MNHSQWSLMIAGMLALATALAWADQPAPSRPFPGLCDGIATELDGRALTLAATPGGQAPAPDAATSQAELAKKLQNPIANLISVPIQYNADFNIGPKNASYHTVNIQPVIPFSICEDWNVITRTIMPLKYNESIADGVDSKWGLGDIFQSFFFSPKEPVNGWVWGVGPVFLWPTGTDDQLGGGKWGAGPTAVLLKQEDGWTYGMLVNHVWSYAGDSDRNSVNATFIQPFLSYTTKTFTTLGINTESTYDWNDSQWTVPINLTVSQLVKLGGRPVQFQLGGRCYAEGPSDGPEWGVRFTVTFLFPK